MRKTRSEVDALRERPPFSRDCRIIAIYLFVISCVRCDETIILTLTLESENTIAIVYVLLYRFTSKDMIRRSENSLSGMCICSQTTPMPITVGKVRMRQI